MKGDIKRIICKLDCNKAHGHDMISIRTLKMSENVDAIIEPLFKIFKNCLNVEHFQMTGKKEALYRFLKRQQIKHQKLSSSITSSNMYQDFRKDHIR